MRSPGRRRARIARSSARAAARQAHGDAPRPTIGERACTATSTRHAAERAADRRVADSTTSRRSTTASRTVTRCSATAARSTGAARRTARLGVPHGAPCIHAAGEPVGDEADAARGARPPRRERLGRSGSVDGRRSSARSRRARRRATPRSSSASERSSVPSTVGAAMAIAAMRGASTGRDDARARRSVDEPPRSAPLWGSTRASAAERLQPGLAGLERLGRLGDGRSVCRRTSRGGEFVLELLDRVVQLAGDVLGARLRLGVVALPVVVFARAQACSILRRRRRRRWTWSRGTLPISSQRRWIAVSAVRALLEVGLGEDRLGLVEQRALRVDLRARTPRRPARRSRPWRRRARRRRP